MPSSETAELLVLTMTRRLEFSGVWLPKRDALARRAGLEGKNSGHDLTIELHVHTTFL